MCVYIQYKHTICVYSMYIFTHLYTYIHIHTQTQIYKNINTYMRFRQYRRMESESLFPSHLSSKWQLSTTFLDSVHKLKKKKNLYVKLFMSMHTQSHTCIIHRGIRIYRHKYWLFHIMSVEISTLGTCRHTSFFVLPA